MLSYDGKNSNEISLSQKRSVLSQRSGRTNAQLQLHPALHVLRKECVRVCSSARVKKLNGSPSSRVRLAKRAEPTKMLFTSILSFFINTPPQGHFFLTN